MTDYHERVPIAPSSGQTQIGDVPTADYFQRIVGAVNYLRNWYGCGPNLFTEFQPPNTTLNPIATSANPLHLYPILWAPDRTDLLDRQLAGVINMWQPGTADDQSVTWYPNYAPGTPGSGTTLFSGKKVPSGVFGTYPDYGDRIKFAPVTLYDGFDYDPDDSTFHARRLTIIGMQIASCTIYHAPTRIIGASQAIVRKTDVQSGRVMRGYTGTGTPSVGDLFHLVGSIDDSEDDVERITRRCLTQIGTPYGYYVGNGVTAYQRVYGSDFTIRAKGRLFSDLFSLEQTGCLPAFVVTGDEGCMIRVTNTENSDTWVYTIPAGGISNPTLVGPTDGTGTITLENYASAANELTIEAKTDTSKEMVIYTSSLWEEGAQ